MADRLSRKNHQDAREVERASREALRLVDRWRKQGFDTLIIHPSGYCSPANSKILGQSLPQNYAAHRLDSPEALVVLAKSGLRVH